MLYLKQEKVVSLLLLFIKKHVYSPVNKEDKRDKKMKTSRLQLIVVFTSFLTLLISLTCCNHHPPCQALSQAELLMEEKPDSALSILKNMTDPDQLPDWDRALYYLLLTQAQDKNYITHTSDSIIKIATQYFENHDDQTHTMLAYYCMGRVYTDLQDALQAQECYLKALELGEGSGNNQLLVKIYNNLGTLYSYQYINEMALPMYQKARQSALLEQKIDSINISFVIRNIARTFSQMQKTDSAIYYYKQALSYSVTKNRASILLDMGSIYLDAQNYQEAESFLNAASISAHSKKTLLPIYLSKGRIFIEKEQLDSAKFYFGKSLLSSNIYTKAASLRYLGQIALKEDNLNKYVIFAEQHEQLHDSIIHNSHFENIRITQSMFNYQLITKDKNKFEKEAAQRMIFIHRISIVFVIILTTGVILFKREQDKKRRLLEIKEQQYKRSQQYLEDNKAQILQLEIKLSTEKAHMSGVQRQLYEARKVMLQMENRTIIEKQGAIRLLEKDFHDASLYLRIHSEEDIQLSKEEWYELRQLIDATYPDFTNRLIKHYTRISKEEIYVCYLVKMKIPIKKIANLVHISSSGVSQCRRRLYKKFTNEPGSTEMFDRFIADL